MADNLQIDPIKARLVQLGFKRATSGLTPEEEAEVKRLNQELALAKAAGG